MSSRSKAKTLREEAKNVVDELEPRIPWQNRPYLTRRTAGSCGNCSKFLIKASSLFMVPKDLLYIVGQIASMCKQKQIGLRLSSPVVIDVKLDNIDIQVHGSHCASTAGEELSRPLESRVSGQINCCRKNSSSPGCPWLVPPQRASRRSGTTFGNPRTSGPPNAVCPARPRALRSHSRRECPP